ncbi:MAG: hypothetical protein RPR98_03010 [Bermanella sp.]
MKLNKLFLAMSLVGASAAMTGCGGSSSSDSPDVVDPVAQGKTTNPVQAPIEAGDSCGTVGTQSGLELLMENGTYLPLCDLNGSITENATLTADNVYRLNGYITVGSGHAELGDSDKSDAEVKQAVKDAGVTLTVDAGVHFRSSGRGSLIITRGSKISAQGTADAPIVMSSFDSGYDGQGEWGGLVIQGFAKNNKCGEGSLDVLCNTADEAGTGYHGGDDDADNSGSISHLIVAEGGYEVAPDSEVNGITLHSVGYGTSIENVMVYNNADDGIEWFGGAVNIKNLILIDNSDESLDWDDGYRGNVQFALVRQGLVNKGDHGIEADNKGLSNTATPISNPTIANVTFQTGPEGADDLFRFKLGTQGTLVNIAADNYKECVRVEHVETQVTLTNLLAECGSYSETENVYVTAKEGALASQVSGVPTASATVELGSAFEVTGGNAAVTSIEPASANGSTAFFTATDYVGAVNPNVTAAENAWFAWAAKTIPAAFE